MVIAWLKKIFTLGRHEDYEAGIKLYNQGLYREALDKFSSLVGSGMQKGSLHGHLARFYTGLAHRNLGLVDLYGGSYQKATESFKMSLEFNPGHFGVYNYLGVCYNNLGQFDRAMETFQRAIQINPDFASIKLKIAIVFHNQSMHDRAIKELKSILGQHPEWADMHYHLGLIMASKGQLAEGLVQIEMAVRINPEYIRARIKLGLLLGLEKRFDDAIINLDYVLEKHPNYPDVHYYRGIFLASRGDLHDALKALQKAIDINPNFTDAHIKTGIVSGRLGRHDEALASFRTALGTNPSDLDADFLVAYIHKLECRRDVYPEPTECEPPQAEDEQKFRAILENFYSQASSELTSRIMINPDFSEIIHLFPPESDYALYQTLIRLYEENVRNNPGFADLRNHLGQFYHRLGRLPDAAEQFTAALEINPGFIKARINLFKTLRDMDRLELAEDHIHRLIQQGVKYPDLYFELGRLQARRGDNQEALESFDQAAQLNPRLRGVHVARAEVLERLGKMDEAVASLERAARIQSTDLSADEIQQRLTRLKGNKD